MPGFTNTALRASEPPTTWDNTMRTTRKQCRRKFYFFLRGFTYQRNETPSYFTWGRAFGEGLNSWYRNEGTLPNTEAHELRKQLSVKAAERLWNEEGPTPKGNDNLENLRAKLFGYFDNFPRERWSYVPGGEELGWVWPLAGTRYMLGGSLDGYANWPTYGLLFVEHKTTGGYLTDNFIRQWDYSSQVLTYSWYLHNLHGGKGVYGGLLNLITKMPKGLRSNWKTPEYYRHLVKKSPWEYDQFEADLTRELADFERDWNDWIWPQDGFQSPMMCAGGPGYSPCPYREICSSAVPFTEAEPQQFNLIYREDEWTPWDRQGES